MKHFIFAATFLWTFCALSLEIDEKLTLRIVKTSESKKTILINRGKEDGIEKGDHAKFYLSVGVVARGAAIKISPTRSVWALYRLVNADYIKDDQVMKLKATAPVKITKDESRTLVEDDAPSITTKDPRDLGIPLAPGAEDIDLTDPMSGQVIQSADAAIMTTNLLRKNKELLGGLYYDARSSQTSSEGSEVSGVDSLTLLDMGFEYYFEDESKWYSRISFLGAYRMLRSSVMSFEGTEVQDIGSFFGGGVNWYPLTRPSKVYKLVPFGQFMYYLGSVTSNYSEGESGGEEGEEVSGSVSMMTFGGGVKYFLHNGWGASAKLEYESRVDSYAESEDGLNWQKVSSGPRLVMGLSYRF